MLIFCIFEIFVKLLKNHLVHFWCIFLDKK